MQVVTSRIRLYEIQDMLWKAGLRFFWSGALDLFGLGYPELQEFAGFGFLEVWTLQAFGI